MAESPSLAARSVPPPITEHYCVQHPSVPAVAVCDGCGAYVCRTCLFEVPGTEQHMCPPCALEPVRGLSRLRMRSLVISYVLAVVATVGTALLWTGQLLSLYTEAPMVVAVLVERLLIFFPAVAGVALSVGTMDRKLGNPPALWASAIWNVTLVVAYLTVLALA